MQFFPLKLILIEKNFFIDKNCLWREEIRVHLMLQEKKNQETNFFCALIVSSLMMFLMIMLFNTFFFAHLIFYSQ